MLSRIASVVMLAFLSSCTVASGDDSPDGQRGSDGAHGSRGADGLEGERGPEGPQGPQGPEGPAGAKGPEGPEGPEGPSGTTGQDIIEVHGTGALTVAPGDMTYKLVPGLSTTVTVPPDALLYVTTSGGVQCTNQASTTAFSVVDVAIAVEETAMAERRIVAANTGGVGGTITNWSFGRTIALTPGMYAVWVAARSGHATGDSATVSGRRTRCSKA